MAGQQRFDATLATSMAVAMFLLGAPPAAAQTDVQTPQLVSLAINPGSVDVTAASADVTFTVRVTDDLSGIAVSASNALVGVGLSVRSPSGNQTLSRNGGVPASGVILDGTFNLTVTFPRFIEPGVWTILNIVLRDNAGNSATLTSDLLSAAGFPAAVTVVNATPDVAPPQVTALTLSPGAVDVSGADAPITVDLTIVDDLSGFNRTGPLPLQDFEMRSPSGAQSRFLAVTQFQLVAGTTTSGTWRATLTMPRYSEPGTWTVMALSIRDVVGNRLTYTADGLTAQFGPAIEVAVASSPADTEPPVLTALSLSPVFIDTAGGSQTVTVQFTATDNLSGVSTRADTNAFTLAIGAIFDSPSGAQRVVAPLSNTQQPTSGTTLNGVWTVTAAFPQFSEEGTWRLSEFRLKDGTRNRATYFADDLEALGFPASLIVIQPSHLADGVIDAGGGVVLDSTFGARAGLSAPPGVFAEPTTVALDVLQSPLDVALPAGFSTAETFFVSVVLLPEPDMPLPAPGVTLVMPLRNTLLAGTAVSLMRVVPETAALEPALDDLGAPIVGIVDASGLSVVFAGVRQFSTLVGILPDPIQVSIDVRPGDANDAITLKANGLLPVAIMSTPTFAAAAVDSATILFAGVPVAYRPQGRPHRSVADVNGDGLVDVVVSFEIGSLALPGGESRVRLTGLTPDGRIFRGEATVRVAEK